MHVEPSKQSFSPSRLNDTEPSEELANFANKDITILPDELFVKIFFQAGSGRSYSLPTCEPPLARAY